MESRIILTLLGMLLTNSALAMEDKADTNCRVWVATAGFWVDTRSDQAKLTDGKGTFDLWARLPGGSLEKGLRPSVLFRSDSHRNWESVTATDCSTGSPSHYPLGNVDQCRILLSADATRAPMQNFEFIVYLEDGDSRYFDHNGNSGNWQLSDFSKSVNFYGCERR